MVYLIYRQIFALQEVSGCAFRRQDHRFHDVVWKGQGNFEFTQLIHNMRGLYIDYIHGEKIWNGRVPTVIRTMSQRILLCDLGIQLANRSLHFVMIREMIEGYLVHLGFDTWGALRPPPYGEVDLSYSCSGLRLAMDGQALASWRFLGRMSSAFTDFSPSGPRRGGYILVMMGSISQSEWRSASMVAPF